MKTSGFLRDIDDERLYAQQLELAWIALGDELAGVLAKWPLIGQVALDEKESCIGWNYDRDHDEIYAELATMRHTMSMLARDMAERNRRLADSAVGLPNVILDKQSDQGHLRSSGKRRDRGPDEAARRD